MMSNIAMKEAVAKKMRQSDVFMHPKMHRFTRKQELIKDFMLALAPAYYSDEDCSAQKIHYFADFLATEFLNSYNEGFKDIKAEIEEELED